MPHPQGYKRVLSSASSRAQLLAAIWGVGAYRRAVEAAQDVVNAAKVGSRLQTGLSSCGVGASHALIAAVFNESELSIRAEEAAGVPVLQARLASLSPPHGRF